MLRSARFTVGIQLHTGRFTIDQSVDFFGTEGYRSRDVGLVETKRGTMDPTCLCDAPGKLQFLKLRAGVAAREGVSFNLEAFIDSVMAQGGPPIRIVRRTLLGNDSPTLSQRSKTRHRPVTRAFASRWHVLGVTSVGASPRRARTLLATAAAY